MFVILSYVSPELKVQLGMLDLSITVMICFLMTKLFKLLLVVQIFTLPLSDKIFHVNGTQRISTDATEIRALVGVLLLTGCFGANRKNSSGIWDNSRGSGIESCYL